MNENQLKNKIFILKSIDNALMLSLVVSAIYGFTYAENKEFMIILCLALLAALGTIGRGIHNYIAKLRVQLDMVRRTNKTEQLRKLMSTR